MSMRPGVRLLLLLSGFFTFSTFAVAMDEWQPVTQEELKLTAASAHATDAIILYHEEISDDNRDHRMVYIRLKIFTERGRDEYANVQIPYSETDFRITDVKGRTIAPDGTITPFTGKPFDKTMRKGYGIKIKAKSFALPNVNPGSIVEYRYTVYWSDRSVSAPHWVLQEELPQRRAHFVFIPYSGSGDVVDEHGNILQVYHTMIGVPNGTEVKRTFDGKLELEMRDLPAFEKEEMAPPDETLKMRVEFFYGTGKMGKANEFWKEQGKYWTKDVEKFIGHSSAIQAAAAQAIAPVDTPEQKVRKLYAMVQKMKNLSYVQDAGLEELIAAKSAEKRTAEDILKKQEGTRDDLTRLFVAMVRAVNIPAFIMRVAPRDETFFQVNIPSWRQLSSEVAIVSIDGKETFLDPGTPTAPFGLLDWKRTAVDGVRQMPDGGTQLAKTPSPEYTQTITARIARVSLADDGSVSGTVKFQWTGQEAISHRLDALQTDEAGRKKDLEDEVQALLPPGSTVQLENSTGWENPEAPLIASFKVNVPSFASLTSKRALFSPALFQSRAKAMFVSPERKYSVYLSYPYRTVDDVQVTFPDGFKLESLPKTEPLNTGFSFYKSERSSNGNTISMRRDFALGGLGFPVQYYPQLKTFFSAVATGDSQQVVLLAAGK